MRLKRSIILPAVLALSTAGSVLAGSAASMAATAAPAAAVATAAHVKPDFVYQG